MRCTGTGSADCYVAFDNGVCSNNLTCTETNFVANEQTNFTCSKSFSVSLYPRSRTTCYKNKSSNTCACGVVCM